MTKKIQEWVLGLLSCNLSLDKFGTVSDMENQLKKDWVEIVATQFKKEFDEEIDVSYMPAFEVMVCTLAAIIRMSVKVNFAPLRQYLSG